MNERVLVPLDGSKVGEAALPVIEEHITKLSPETNVEVTLLGVITQLRHWVVVGEASAPISYTEEELKGIEKPVVTIFGVAYKGNVGDTRQSPAKRIISILLERGFGVRVFDPLVDDLKYELLPLEKAVEGSDCIVVLADHRFFNKLDPGTILSLMRNKKVIDTRNCLSSNWKKAGFNVRILGNG